MLKLYNTLSNSKQAFKSLEPGKVRMYTCGPTVYNYAHIGNLAAYIYADILRRYLEFSGYEVRHIVNITDVGHLTSDDVNQADSGQDKMLKAALKEKKTPQDIANFYADAFFDDVKKLNIEKANYYPRATAHIPQMIKTIQILIEKGYAYEKNGNVFFDVEKFPDYGKLSNKKIDELKHGSRLDEHPDKKHQYDFVLWLKAPKEHLLKWDSPWSVGYPGWHIECSAMSMEYLGETLDIHTGGEDHIFPHHENEIAQSQCSTGKEFSRFWFHNHFLLVDGQKMSKSKGNFYTLASIIEKGFSPMEFRLLVLGSHYRSNLNFTWEALKQAKSNYQKISRFANTLKKLAPKTDKTADKSSNVRYNERSNANAYADKFQTALDDDLNTPLALSVLFELINWFNKENDNNKISPALVEKVNFVWKIMNKVLGLEFEAKAIQLPEKIRELIDQREQARQKKDFQESDRLRGEIEKAGYVVEDTAEGQSVHKKS